MGQQLTLLTVVIKTQSNEKNKKNDSSRKKLVVRKSFYINRRTGKVT